MLQTPTDTIALAPIATAVLAVEGTHNFRSTAGYAASTRAIRPGSLFRSDALHRLSDAGSRQLVEHGIVRIIDLRTTEELAEAPSALVAAGVETVHHPIFGSAGVPLANGSITLAELYRHMIDERTERLTGALRLIVDAPEGGVLVHCTAGKDRTGLVVAAALLAVGVERDQVVADYAASGDNLAGEWSQRILAATAERFGDLSSAVQELLLASPADALEATLDHIDARFGGIVPMLSAYGFTETELARLRARLLD